MATRRKFHPDFVKDVSAAVADYDSISFRLGSRFRDSLRDRIQLVSGNPAAFATIHKTVRAVRLRRFPYVLLYPLAGEELYFIALVLGATDREHWFERSGT